MPVPMIDLKAQYESIREEIDSAVAQVLASQQFRGGAISEAFERAICAYTGTRHALGVATGTDALLLTYRSLGIRPGDEIITTPFTFFATAGAIVNSGARAVFVDIDPGTFNIEPGLVEAAITEKTRAIVPVHLFGQPAEMDALLAIGRRHGIPVIEDTAQGLGATYRGHTAGSLGLAGTLSFYPTKNLGAAGEGGMVITNDDQVADQVKLLRCHGSQTQYYHSVVGTNSHLHAIQAAVLLAKLPHLDGWNQKRGAAAMYYTEQLAEYPEIILPVTAPARRHVWHQYVIRIPRRDAAVALLRDRGIGCGVFYPLPLHKQECFRDLAAPAHCPEAERASSEVLALPMFAEITREQQDEVIAALGEHLRSA